MSSIFNRLFKLSNKGFFAHANIIFSQRANIILVLHFSRLKDTILGLGWTIDLGWPSGFYVITNKVYIS